jgi:hypothetical protein
MDEPETKHDIKHWPFRVRDNNGIPAITVKYKGEDRDFVIHSSYGLIQCLIECFADARRNQCDGAFKNEGNR